MARLRPIFSFLIVLAGSYLQAAEPRAIPDLGLTLMPIPAGAFTMGSPVDEPGRRDDEGPLTHVVISNPFWLGRTVVTHAQWRAVMGTDLLEQARRSLRDQKKVGDPNRLVLNAADDAPMYWVSWVEAGDFCQRLTGRERAAGRLLPGYEYRLPTEAEWEYACRAGTTTATYAGDLIIIGAHNAPVLDDIAWYGGNSNIGYTGNGWDTSKLAGKEYPGRIAGPHSVATRKPNAWGLYDMIGNVTQWCNDWYGDKLPGGEVVDPLGPISGSRRVVRGDGWANAARFSRAACRWPGRPESRTDTGGFRIALAPIASPYSAEARFIPELGLKLMRIPAGNFVMGSRTEEIGHRDNESPPTRVALTRPFWLGQTEVTQAQWRSVMGTDWDAQIRKIAADDRQLKRESDPTLHSFAGSPDTPMFWISWTEATAFCHRLTDHERAAGRLPQGYEYRLPTEAEWEYACRAGTTTATYEGDLDLKGLHHAPVLDGIAWYGGNSNVDYAGKGADISRLPGRQYPGGISGPHPVATKGPNAWGLYDMLGNVFEWCGDWYADKLPGGEVSDPHGPASGKYQVIRGGSWVSAATVTRGDTRFFCPPTEVSSALGFRIALAPAD